MGILQVWLGVFFCVGGGLTAFWLAFEFWLIGSFFWAYIDEHKWQLPKPLERIFFNYHTRLIGYKERDIENSIYRINCDSWVGAYSYGGDHFGGRVVLASFGLIGRVCVAWIAAAAWPIFLLLFVILLLMRSLRFMRRTQKTVGKLADVAHRHGGKDKVEPVEINRPRF